MIKRWWFRAVCVLMTVALVSGVFAFLALRLVVSSSEGFVSISLEQNIAHAATEEIYPTGQIAWTNLSGSYTTVDEDADAPLGDWASAVDTGANVLAHVSFDNPSGNLNTGAGLQTFKAWVRKEGGSSTGTGQIDLYEGGSLLASGTPVNITNTSGQMITLSWDASLLADVSGASVEAYVLGTNSGGNPSKRAVMGIDAVEWDVDYSAGSPDISVSPSSFNYGAVQESSTNNTTTSYFTITNASTIQTDQTISVTTNSWSGGVGWTHSDTATPGADTAGLLANRGGTWGTGDVIVKFSSPNFIYENKPAGGSYGFGLGLWAPTSFSDGAEKTITVRITATAG